ncbi:MAG: CopG family transcriptional regulator [Mesorhizobium sp.]
MRDRLNASLPVGLIARVNELAVRKRLTRSAVVEAALESFLSPDSSDMQEAAYTRRMDRLSRQASRIERDLHIATETLALFVRFWLTITPPLDPDANASAQAKGRERFEGFVEVLGQRLQSGDRFFNEIPEDVERKDQASPNAPEAS